jgi:hypothetical protein
MGVASDDGTYSANSSLAKYYELTNEAAKKAGMLFAFPCFFPSAHGCKLMDVKKKKKRSGFHRCRHAHQWDRGSRIPEFYNEED